MGLRPLTSTVRVFANPWHDYNHEGIAQAAHPLGDGRYVGAAVDPIASRIASKEMNRVVVRFVFPPGVVELKLDRGIAEAVRTGGLIAADLKSAELCGIAAADFVEPQAQLAKEKEALLARAKAAYGPEATITDPPTAFLTPDAETLSVADKADASRDAKVALRLASPPKEA